MRMRLGWSAQKERRNIARPTRQVDAGLADESRTMHATGLRYEGRKQRAESIYHASQSTNCRHIRPSYHRLHHFLLTVLPRRIDVFTPHPAPKKATQSHYYSHVFVKMPKVTFVRYLASLVSHPSKDDTMKAEAPFRRSKKHPIPIDPR